MNALGLRRVRRLGIPVLAALLALLAVQPTMAHSEYQKSTPVDGAKLAASPARIVATFSAVMKPASSRLRLKDPAGTIIATGGVPAGDSARRTMTIENLPVLDPGKYTVLWNTVALDNDPANGSFVFTVLAPPSPSPTVTPEPTAAPTAPPTIAPTAAPSTPGAPSSAPSATAGATTAAPTAPAPSATASATPAAGSSSPGATTLIPGGAGSSGGSDSTTLILIAAVVIGAAIGAGLLIARRRA